MRYNFTDKEIKEILSNLTVVIDNREQANLHITDWLDKKKLYEALKAGQEVEGASLKENESLRIK